MQKLYTTENKVMIYLLKSKLDENGIQSLIKNDQPPLAGEIPPIIAWPELWLIDDEQLEQAKKIVQDELASAHHQEAWVCKNCGERSPGEFNICWKCGTSR